MHLKNYTGGEERELLEKTPEPHTHLQMHFRHPSASRFQLYVISGILAAAVAVVGVAAIAGVILGIVAVVNTPSSSSVDLPANTALLTDPSAVVTGLVSQNNRDLTVIPFVVDNTTISFTVESVGIGAAVAINGTNQVRGLRTAGTLDLAYTVVGDDVLLTGNLPSNVATLCGLSCTANDVLTVAPNGTCLLCNTGVSATSFMRTCGTCPPFSSVRLAANSSCYECLTIPASSIFTGSAGVEVTLRANDTVFYQPIWSWLAEPYNILTPHVQSFVYTSGSYEIRAYTPGFPGYSNPGYENTTAYSLDVSMEGYLAIDDPTLFNSAILFSLTPLLPNWLSNLPATGTQYTSSGHVECTDLDLATNFGSTSVRMIGPCAFDKSSVGGGLYCFFVPGLPDSTIARCTFEAHVKFTM